MGQHPTSGGRHLGAYPPPAEGEPRAPSRETAPAEAGAVPGVPVETDGYCFFTGLRMTMSRATMSSPSVT
jgi:hypothetical protein